MTYNLSRETFERWRAELDLLLTNAVIRYPTENSHMLAYSLREALAAARHHAIEPYSLINYVFRERPGVVIAEPKKTTVKAKGEIALTELDLPATTEFSVIQAMLTHKPHRAVFPYFTGDITAVQRWATANGYVTTQPPLTLTKEKIATSVSKKLHQLSHPPEEREHGVKSSDKQPDTGRPRPKGDR